MSHLDRRRALTGARLLWAVELLAVARPGALRRASSPDPLLKSGARLLAARHLIEAVVLATRPEMRPPRLMIGVDSLHAASMFAVAAVSHRLRRAALISAVVSCVLATWSAAER